MFYFLYYCYTLAFNSPTYTTIKIYIDNCSQSKRSKRTKCGDRYMRARARARVCVCMCVCVCVCVCVRAYVYMYVYA